MNAMKSHAMPRSQALLPPRLAASFNHALQATPVGAGLVALSRRPGVPDRSAASGVMRVFEHTELRGSGVASQVRAHGWSSGSRLAQIRAWLGESARCVGEVRACRRVRSHHGSRQFQSGLAMSARRRLRTWIIPSPMHPPNHQVETNRCQASRLRSWPVIGDSFPVCHGTLTAAVAHLKR